MHTYIVPAHARSAYQFFKQDRREQMREENRDLKSDELTIAVKAAWLALSSDDKKPFERLAKMDKTRYEKQMARVCYHLHTWILQIHFILFSLWLCVT
jgi:hypothetical protein